MSAELMAWALRQDLGPAPKVVLIALCDQVSDQPGKEFFWGSQAWLAGKIHSNERSVRGHLKTLEDDGWIKREKRKIKGVATTDAIYVCHQRQEVADGKKPSSPAASLCPDQRQEPADKNLTENLTENLIPLSFDVFWKEWITDDNKNDLCKSDEARVIWEADLSEEEKADAIAAIPGYQRYYRIKTPDRTFKMLGAKRYLSEIIHKSFCKPPTTEPPASLEPDPDDPYHDYRAALLRRAGLTVYNNWLALMEIEQTGARWNLTFKTRFLCNYARQHYSNHLEAVFGEDFRCHSKDDPPLPDVSRETKTEHPDNLGVAQ